MRYLLILSIFVSAAFAHDYYIATNGDNSHAGTISAPWASVKKAADSCNPGDTIYVRGGTYAPTGSMVFHRSGNSSAPITFRAYPGESVVLDGANMSSFANVVYISAQHFTMQDFEVRNGKLNGITIENTSNVTVRNCKVHDAWHSGIYVGTGNMTATHDITVDGCTVYNNVHMNDEHTLSSGWSGALVAGGAVSVTFKNNTVYNNQGEGIIFYLADRCSALNNISHDNFGVNLYLDNATHCVVSGNFLYCSGNETYFANNQPATGIQYANESYATSNPSADNLIVNNIFVKNNRAFYFGNYGSGAALKNFTFAYNSIYLSNREMIHIDPAAHSNALFCNNISFQSDGGAQMDLPNSLSGLKFSNNVWYGGDVGAAWSDSDVYADPQFVNAGTFNAADYKLKAGSPAVEKGISVANVTTDFFGVTRDSPVDVGASEISGSIVVPPPDPPDPPDPPGPPDPPEPIDTPLTVSTVRMTFNLSKPNVDTLTAKGFVTLPQSFTPSGVTAVLSVGNFQRTVTLNARGVSDDRTFRLTGRLVRGAYKFTNVGFALSVKRSSLFGQFAGLSDANGLYTQDVNVRLTVGGNNFVGNGFANYKVAGGQ